MSVSSNKVSVAPLGSRRDVLIGAAAMATAALSRCCLQAR